MESWGEETFCIKGVSDNLKEGEGEGWGNWTPALQSMNDVTD